MRTKTRVGRAIGCALLVAMGLGTAPRQADAIPPNMPGVQLVQAWPGFKFQRPICTATDGTAMYVCEQPGRIRRIAPASGSGPVPQPTLYLDVSSRVDPRGQGGLLCLAFHPQFKTNGRLFISYLAPGVGGAKYEFRVCELKGNAKSANPMTELPLVRVPKSRPSHNAGGIVFGPDGMLYVAIGDNAGRTAADQSIAQSHLSKLGKILRIDVSTPNKAGVPADNPWATSGGELPLIFAYGYRNPWRIAFDAAGSLWATEPGMKGPTSQEWISKVVSGGNGRWPFYEGTRHRPEIQGKMNPPAQAPAFTYSGADTGGDNAALGGRFYRGKAIPALKGKFVFCDNVQKKVYAIDLSSGRGKNWVTLGTCKGPADIGEDANGELYVSAIETGVIYKLKPK